MMGQTNKERGRQASTVRYRGVSILQPNPLAFEGRPNILFTWLPSLAGAHTRDITDARIHTFHKAQCAVLLVYSGNTSLVDTVEHNIQLGSRNKTLTNGLIVRRVTVVHMVQQSIQSTT